MGGRVLCVDDNEFIGEALQLKLSQVGGFKWLGQLMDAEKLVDEAARMQPDLVLLDIDMPGKDPFQALEELADKVPQAKVVMLTGHVRDELIDKAFGSGAWGYLSKSESTDTIVRALQRVMDGEVVLGPDVEDVLGK